MDHCAELNDSIGEGELPGCLAPGSGNGDRARAGGPLPGALALLAAVLACCWACGCAGQGGEVVAELKASGEQWDIAGIARSERKEGKWPDDWAAVFHFPNGGIVRLLSDDEPSPDGWNPNGLHYVAYNEADGILVCMAFRLYGPSPFTYFAEVWWRDMKTGRSDWIGCKQWQGIGAMSWSPDGRRLAFVGTPLAPQSDSIRGTVYVYDFPATRLSAVSDDGRFEGSMPDRTHAPAWSEDGKYLYYASIGNQVTRVDTETLEKVRLPMVASSGIPGTVYGIDLTFGRRTGTVAAWHAWRGRSSRVIRTTSLSGATAACLCFFPTTTTGPTWPSWPNTVRRAA